MEAVRKEKPKTRNSTRPSTPPPLAHEPAHVPEPEPVNWGASTSNSHTNATSAASIMEDIGLKYEHIADASLASADIVHRYHEVGTAAEEQIQRLQELQEQENQRLFAAMDSLLDSIGVDDLKQEVKVILQEEKRERHVAAAAAYAQIRAYAQAHGYLDDRTRSQAPDTFTRHFVSSFQENERRAAVSSAQKDLDDQIAKERKDAEISAKYARRAAELEIHIQNQKILNEQLEAERVRLQAEEKRKEQENKAWVASLTAPSPEEMAVRALPAGAYKNIQLKRQEIEKIESGIRSEERIVADRIHEYRMESRKQAVILANSAMANYLKLQDGLERARGELGNLPQDEFVANPEGFLQHIIVSTGFDQGLAKLYPEVPNSLRMEFINAMKNWDRHWFRLAPHQERERRGYPSFILTPALEKYAEEFPQDKLLAQLRDYCPVSPQRSYVSAAYVPYFTGKPSPGDFKGTIGNARVRREQDSKGREFSPDFVFTPAMNGCAFTVTRSEDPDYFTAWHFQSPGANREQVDEFLLGEKPTDWFGDDRYESAVQLGLFETTNILWRSPEGWKILSQETKYSHLDRDDVHGMKFGEWDLKLSD